MSCNSCSNITLPVVPGPAGAPGAPGAAGAAGTNGTNGTNGQDGIAVIDLDTAINNTTSATYDNVKTKNVVGGTLVNVGDFLRVEADVIGDQDDTRTTYYFRVKFGTIAFFETYTTSDGNNGSRIILDLIVTDTNEITPYVSSSRGQGFRSAQALGSNGGTISFLQSSLTSTVTLSGDLDLEIDLRSDGTKNVSLTHYKLIKYKKLV
jgi:hypothetical protein